MKMIITGISLIISGWLALCWLAKDFSNFFYALGWTSVILGVVVCSLGIFKE
jgi:uncharacterized membrane protein HdeD (DUF308 family)